MRRLQPALFHGRQRLGVLLVKRRNALVNGQNYMLPRLGGRGTYFVRKRREYAVLPEDSLVQTGTGQTVDVLVRRDIAGSADSQVQRAGMYDDDRVGRRSLRLEKHTDGVRARSARTTTAVRENILSDLRPPPGQIFGKRTSGWFSPPAFGMVGELAGTLSGPVLQQVCNE